MLLITSLIRPASLNWESSRRILHSLWTLKSFILVCRWPLKKLLESFQMLLELLLQSLQLSWLMFWVFGNFQFPFPLGSREIPKSGLQLEAESHPGHSFHNLKICRLFQRGWSWQRSAPEMLQVVHKKVAPEMLTSLLPTLSVSYRNHAKPCFPAHGRNHLQGTVFSFRVQVPLESALPQKVSMCFISGLSSFYLGCFLDAFSRTSPMRRRGISCWSCLFLSTD